MPDITEKNFEATIEEALLAGGYRKRGPQDYDPELCLDADMVIAFVQATQPKEWAKLKKQYGDQARPRFLKRLAHEIAARGTLDVLRKGVKDVGAKIRLAYFRPASSLNPDLQTLYQANLFSVARQLHYSLKDADQEKRKSLDMAISLNGLPLFTVELKNPLTGQDYRDAIIQYQTRRDPAEPLFAFGRCLAHFAVDPDEVWVTTHLKGQATTFLPFNQGRNNGAGNPIPPMGKFAAAYLWEQVWATDSLLGLIERFIYEVEVLDDKSRPTGGRRVIFPRYHQLDAVSRLAADARDKGPGQRYLIQHSAGSGKSYTIAWLAHQLATLHNAQDQAVFDSVIVVTDRQVLDRQLQVHVRQFEQTRGLVENIDKTSRQLKKALEDGKKIIVTTLQKFPVISEQIGDLPGHHFAVLIDEAHSSQSGEQSKHLKAVLAAGSLEQAAEEEDEEGEDWQDEAARAMRQRGPLPNASFFAFTATPKPKTLELFGARQPDGSFRPFSLYSMRQAIEEHFIMDVLEHYTTYRAYWSLLKKVQDDPHYDRHKATALLKHYVELHDHAIEQKVAIVVDHFNAQMAYQIGGQAKAMIVTRSRLHAVRYKLALDRYLHERQIPYQTLVAFSGVVQDPEDGQKYREAGMNGIPESQTAETFRRAEYRFLVVADKFQTGFDQPMLAAMYVDKKLAGVHAVQTLSRLNRVHPDKPTTQVLDFANEAEDIRESFAPYYETTLLTEATDPNLLYDLQARLDDFHFYTQAEVDRLAEIWFTAEKSAQAQKAHPKIQAALQPALDRYKDAHEDERDAFRGYLDEYVRLYVFLSQILSFVDVDLEKRYLFGRLLLRLLREKIGRLPYDILGKVDLASYQLYQTHAGQIELERGPGKLEPGKLKEQRGTEPVVMASLSEILTMLRERFGLEGISPHEGEQFIVQLEQRLTADEGLAASVRVNTQENARLTFNHVVTDRVQDMVDVSFMFYKLLNDDPAFAAFFQDVMFARYMHTVQAQAGTR